MCHHTREENTVLLYSPYVLHMYPRFAWNSQASASASQMLGLDEYRCEQLTLYAFSTQLQFPKASHKA